MQALSADHLGYTIKVTAQLTGISVDQLRVWERRYGFPCPERSRTGARFYSQADIERLRLIAKALTSGWRARDAVLAQPSDLKRALALVHQPPTSPRTRMAGEATTIQELLSFLRRNDVESLKLELRRLAALHGPKSFVIELVAPLMTEIGDAWARGDIEVRHEHLMTELVSAQLRVLTSAYDHGGPHAATVLLATFPHEQHGVGLEMAALYFAAEGFRARLLGTDTPPEETRRAALELRANIVGVTISGVAPPLDSVRHLTVLRDGLPADVEIWLGGAGARALGPQVPGVAIISDFYVAQATLERYRARHQLRRSS